MRFVIIIFFIANNIHAQSHETAFVSEAIQNAINLYETEMSDQSQLVNGSSYNRIQLLHSNRSHFEDAHPYYVFEWTPGTVFYDGQWYRTSLLYDISTDNLIVFNADLKRQILLVKEKIKQFNLNHHQFVKLDGDLGVDNGFYEVLYAGSIQVYLRTKKNMERAVGSRIDVPYKYVTRNSYYIKKEGLYYEVKNKASVLKVLSEQRPVLKEFMRLKSFKENPSFYINEMARIYDQYQSAK